MELKIAIFLVVMSVTTVFATSSYSQTAKVSLEMENTTLEMVMDEIERQCEFYFIFNQKQIDVDRLIDIQAEDKLIDGILKDLFDGTDVSYTVLDRKILLTNEPRDNTAGPESQPDQQNRITGTILDTTTGEPMPGVNIQVKGTTIGALTDINGKYTLVINDPNAVLIFSFIGYATQEVPLSGKPVIDVAMTAEVLGLEEVVVVGYGTQKKVNLTGAVGSASAETLEARPITSAGQGLQGVIPNLNITIADGDPNTKADFNIRGYTSITGGKPLILVDGVPMNLEGINPNDIKSISVLKDAASSAIYGARAAFGVILVETKRGQAGKLRIDFSTEHSLAKPIFRIEPVANSYLHAVTYNDAYMLTQGTNVYDQSYLDGFQRYIENPTKENEWEVVNGVLRYYGNNNYQDNLITDFAPQQKYDFSISGGSENTNYYVSFGHLNKDGYLRSEKNENFKRYNVTAKSDFKVFDWLKFDESITINTRMDNKPHFYYWDVNINSAARVPPMMPIKFPDLPYYITPGDHDTYSRFIGMYMGGKNPENVRIYNDLNFFPYLENGGRETLNEYDIWLSQGVTMTPLKGLTVRGDFSYQIYYSGYQDVASNIEIVAPTLTNPDNMISNGFSQDDYINNRNDFNRYYVLNVYADYLFDKIPDHTIKAIVGYNQEYGSNSYSRASAKDLLYPDIWDINATSGVQNAYGSKSHYALRGVFARLNYDYKEKYLIEFNGRYDGTSRFPKESRFGFFPSVSMGWRISEEPFMAISRQWLDNLKLRASYGQLGNQALGGDDQPKIVQNWGGYRNFTSGGNFYPYISNMGTGRGNHIFSSGQEPYVSPGGLISPTLTWETVTSMNIGLDFSILKGKLDVSGDIYRRDTKDMLMRISYPSFLGASAPNANSADLRTNGWELSIKWRDDIGTDWNYGVTLGLSDNQATITKYENPNGALSTNYVGKKVGEIWGFETVGFFQTQDEIAEYADQTSLGANWKPGDIMYRDLNQDNKINRGANTLSDPGDQKIIGNNLSRYPFGINGDITYKNFSLNVFFQGVGKRDYYPPYGTGNTAFWPFNGEAVFDYFVTDTWTEENRDAYFFVNQFGGSNWRKNAQTQTKYLQDASYVRLKNLRLNYQLPQNLITKIGLISSAQVYFTGMNLWEYTKMYKILDPEVTTTSGTQRYYLQRIYTLGVKITL